MAFSVNKAIVLGNAGKDAEIRYTQSGKAVANFSVATSEKKKDGTEVTEWHRVVAWEKLAELCGRLVTKGSKVYVEGKFQTKEYTDKNGNRRFSTEIVAREMVFMGGSAGRQEGSRSYVGRDNQQAQGGGEGQPYADDEEIPF